MTGSDSSRGGPSRPDAGEGALRDEVTQLISETSPPLPDLDGLRSALRQEMASERGLRAHLRSRPTPVRVAIAGGAVLSIAALAAFAALRPDIGVYPLERMVAILLFIAVAIGVKLSAALRPIHRPAWPLWLPGVATLVGLCGLFLLYALPVAHLDHPASVHEGGLDALLRRAIPCLIIGGVAALTVFAVLRALDRGGSDRALLAAACGGLAANLGLQLHCPLTAPGHMLLGHLGVAVLLVGAVALHRALSRRRST